MLASASASASHFCSAPAATLRPSQPSSAPTTARASERGRSRSSLSPSMHSFARSLHLANLAMEGQDERASKREEKERARAAAQSAAAAAAAAAAATTTTTPPPSSSPSSHPWEQPPLRSRPRYLRQSGRALAGEVMRLSGAASLSCKCLARSPCWRRLRWRRRTRGKMAASSGRKKEETERSGCPDKPELSGYRCVKTRMRQYLLYCSGRVVR